MPATKLQTTQTNLALSKINVNGRRYDIDKDLCVVVDNVEDIDKLTLLGWSASIGAVKQVKVSPLIKPGSSLRGAGEFVELIQQDAKLAITIGQFKTFEELSSYALTMGFKFLENDLKAAGQAYVEKMNRSAQVDANNAAKLAEVPKVSGVEDAGDLQAVTSEFAMREDLPETMPEETSGVWPDPEETMSLPYLRRMAAAYKVKYASKTLKPALLKKLNEAVFSA